MAISVDILVKDTQVVPAPISGVTVNVYDPVTKALVAQGTTDGSGNAAFLLPGAPGAGINYEVRFFKTGVLFWNPHLISVQDPLDVGNTNIFDISGSVQTLPVATDPRMCRCTGVFVDMQNLPRAGVHLELSFEAEAGRETPKILDGRMLVVRSLIWKTDAEGKISIDLVRGGKFFVHLGWEDDRVWPIEVPDRSSVNLVDLIHPAPAVLSYDAPGNALSIAVGETKQVQASVLFTDFITRTTELSRYVQFNVSNANVDVAFDNANGKLTLLGREAGSASVTPSLQAGLLPARTPDFSMVAPALAVTVTP